jgi:hypothetical protein
MVSVPRYADWATIWGNGSSIVEAFDSLVEPTPCKGEEHMYDLATESFVARWVAAQKCGGCPIREQCGEAGAAGREIGVWGGKFSADGTNWHDVRPVRQSNLVRTLEAAIANKRGIGMVSAADKILPGLKALLTDQGGALAYSTKGQCIRRNSRRITTPDGRRESIRAYIMTTLMCVEMGEGRGSIHVTCSTPGCIAPWHLRYTRGGGAPTTARSVALALFIFAERAEWSTEAASMVTGLHKRDLNMLREVSACLHDLNPVPDPVLVLMRDTFAAQFGRDPATPEMTALIRICSAADVLDCATMKDLIDVGETEF